MWVNCYNVYESSVPFGELLLAWFACHEHGQARHSVCEGCRPPCQRGKSESLVTP